MVMFMKTTIILRDDLYSLLIRLYGPRGISKAINDFVGREILKKRRSMFKADPTLKTFAREEDEHDRFS